MLRMRLVTEGPESVQITISDQSPASVLSIRTPSGAVMDSVLALLEPHATTGERQTPATPDLLQCEAAGDWRYCVVIAAARASSPTYERLDALATYLRGSRDAVAALALTKSVWSDDPATRCHGTRTLEVDLPPSCRRARELADSDAVRSARATAGGAGSWDCCMALGAQEYGGSSRAISSLRRPASTRLTASRVAPHPGRRVTLSEPINPLPRRGWAAQPVEIQMLAEPVLPVTVFIIEVAEQEQRRLMPLFPVDECHVVTLSAAHLDDALPTDVPDVLVVNAERGASAVMETVLYSCVAGGRVLHSFCAFTCSRLLMRSSCWTTARTT